MDPRCFSCPRACGANRREQPGVCGVGASLRVARAALHFDEEPVISGTHGSGAVFFSGCSLGCVFCQNYEISSLCKGKDVTPERLKEIFAELKAQGAHNLNLVTPSHYTLLLAPFLENAHLPVVWNSSAYETVDSLRLLEGKVSVFLPDFKFGLREPAIKYANAADYPARAEEAISEMFRQTGPYRIENGLLTRGVLVRHLILPGNTENSIAVLQKLAARFRKGDILISLMSQYTPCRPLRFDELNRRLTRAEYLSVRNSMLRLGLTEGFVQDLSSASASYTPAFDLTGV